MSSESPKDNEKCACAEWNYVFICFKPQPLHVTLPLIRFVSWSSIHTHLETTANSFNRSPSITLYKQPPSSQFTLYWRQGSDILSSPWQNGRSRKLRQSEVFLGLLSHWQQCVHVILARSVGIRGEKASLISEQRPFALNKNCDGFFLSNMHVLCSSLIKYLFKCRVPEIVQ